MKKTLLLATGLIFAAGQAFSSQRKPTTSWVVVLREPVNRPLMLRRPTALIASMGNKTLAYLETHYNAGSSHHAVQREIRLRRGAIQPLLEKLAQIDLDDIEQVRSFKNYIEDQFFPERGDVHFKNPIQAMKDLISILKDEKYRDITEHLKGYCLPYLEKESTKKLETFAAQHQDNLERPAPAGESLGQRLKRSFKKRIAEVNQEWAALKLLSFVGRSLRSRPRGDVDQGLIGINGDDPSDQPAPSRRPVRRSPFTRLKELFAGLLPSSLNYDD